MNGHEFFKKLKKLGKAQDVDVRFERKRGKGSHGTVYFGSRKTILKDRNKEIGNGLKNAMLDQLGVDKADWF